MPTAVIEKAWDDLIEENYATASDVETLLTGILTDITDSDPLSQVLSSTERTTLIASYLDAAGDEVRRLAGRDFGYHEDKWVYVDSSGVNYIDLGNRGFWPLVEVSDAYYVDIYSSTRITDLDELLVFPSGLIAWKGTANFAKAVHGIKLKITWGWEDPPDEIVRAQAMLAAARLLEYITSTKNVDGIGGVQVIQYGEMQIRQYQQGRFWQTIKSWREQAEKICKSYRGVKLQAMRVYDKKNYGERIQALR